MTTPNRSIAPLKDLQILLAFKTDLGFVICDREKNGDTQSQNLARLRHGKHLRSML
jgi:hypothetical protein